MRSLWNDTAQLPEFEGLEGDIRTDVLIVGGGMAGILCAHMLRNAGADCALIEAGRLGSGITGCTTAKITSQHGLIYDKLIRRFGEEKAGMYLQMNEEALEQYRQMGADIDCGFEEKRAYTYSIDDRDKLEREAAAVARLGFRATLREELPLPFQTAGAVCFERQAQFHPLQFLAGIVPGLHIYENTKLLELGPGEAKTDRGTIRADSIIIATHFPLLNKHGGYPLKLYQSRSYVLALKNAAQVDGMYIDEATGGLSFRNYGDMLLLGGGEHRTGKRGGGWAELERLARSCYPEAKELYRWAAQDCMTLDGVPYIGEYARGAKGLYVATGFNKWGMTGAMSAAMILRDMLTGRVNPCAEVFKPARSVLHPQLALNAAESLINLLTPTTPRCPHLGCALKWNAQERSWDCPCHGSRFTEQGQLIDNPATDDMKIKE